MGNTIEYVWVYILVLFFLKLCIYTLVISLWLIVDYNREHMSWLKLLFVIQLTPEEHTKDMQLSCPLLFPVILFWYCTNVVSWILLLWNVFPFACHWQDLSKLNRNPAKVMYLSGHALESCLQPENCVPIKPWVQTDKDDTALVDFIPFLECKCIPLEMYLNELMFEIIVVRFYFCRYCITFSIIHMQLLPVLARLI